jgi:hypothetical protein
MLSCEKGPIDAQERPTVLECVIIDFGSNDIFSTVIPYISFAMHCDVRLRWVFCTPGK